MSWTWRLERADGTVIVSRDLVREAWISQSDAESWLGEHWPALAEAGVAQVSLLENDRVAYGPMSLAAGPE